MTKFTEKEKNILKKIKSNFLIIKFKNGIGTLNDKKKIKIDTI